MGKIMDYTYSYSGADCRAYAFFPGSPENMIDLSSLATISISVHEAKSPVRRLGERGVSGYTRGIRTIAGSMVFLVIEDHPLWKLIYANNNYSPGYSSTDWNRDSDRSISKTNQRKLSTMIRPFNIMLVYQTEIIKNTSLEHAKRFTSDEKASLMIEKIDILNEGLVTSVNDMVTEIQMQFVAQDYYSLEKEEAESYLLSYKDPMILEINKENPPNTRGTYTPPTKRNNFIFSGGTTSGGIFRSPGRIQLTEISNNLSKDEEE